MSRLSESTLTPSALTLGSNVTLTISISKPAVEANAFFKSKLLRVNRPKSHLSDEHANSKRSGLAKMAAYIQASESFSQPAALEKESNALYFSGLLQACLPRSSFAASAISRSLRKACTFRIRRRPEMEFAKVLQSIIAINN